ncbi:hypothetical protein SDC9_79443 [bioreactor metagenome]|uniref:Uncharacterized protein n=1 Tax=bioreactor metagenome TaxID=1076179 RepID=A0A644YWY2_9ZZZZ
MRTENVPTLMPPAVEPEAPPINMSSMDSMAEAGVKAAWLTVLNPAVLQVTDWNVAAINLFAGGRSPSVPGLSHSKNRKKAAPPAMSSAVTVSTSLL